MVEYNYPASIFTSETEPEKKENSIKNNYIQCPFYCEVPEEKKGILVVKKEDKDIGKKRKYECAGGKNCPIIDLYNKGLERERKIAELEKKLKEIKR